MHSEDPLHYTRWHKPTENLQSKKWIAYLEKMTEIALKQYSVKLKQNPSMLKIRNISKEIWQFVPESILTLWEITKLILNPDDCFPPELADNIFTALEKNNRIDSVLKKYLKQLYDHLKHCVTISKLKQIIKDLSQYMEDHDLVKTQEAYWLPRAKLMDFMCILKQPLWTKHCHLPSKNT